MSNVDDALDRLDVWADAYESGFGNRFPRESLATVREALERLREELRVITNERDELYEANWPWEWVIATREKERRQAAEAEVRRLTEGLREIVGESYGILTQGESRTQKRGPAARRIYDKARALLSASPSAGGGAK